ncbi:hypothetical protein E2562_026511 [Oryza meyeriana var. granulata]|uniref:4-hydroxy-7-methoxy-3-oxo-3,4-dihydro-2H-1,4-benzoxazin-2-yl glucosidebeta-D-glucosidase n=1 Tax=Oryza meyeriana var. granulata TaxID=110450 RepID=A0A6G1DMQ3_9ORYZ|nr:hypothetical protein E2562_026511 [Oryza meyeriana var. granulata]
MVASDGGGGAKNAAGSAAAANRLRARALVTGGLAGSRVLLPPPSSSSLFIVVVFLLLDAATRGACALTRRDFPEGFVFGAGTSAFPEDYTAYAEVCFKNFGDRVKHWATMNDPNIEPISGYDTGFLPPRRCSFLFGTNCTDGDSSTEPYIVAHHLLLAHASAVSLCRQKYQVYASFGARGLPSPDEESG